MFFSLSILEGINSDYAGHHFQKLLKCFWKGVYYLSFAFSMLHTLLVLRIMFLYCIISSSIQRALILSRYRIILFKEYGIFDLTFLKHFASSSRYCLCLHIQYFCFYLWIFWLRINLAAAILWRQC